MKVSSYLFELSEHILNICRPDSQYVPLANHVAVIWSNYRLIRVEAYSAYDEELNEGSYLS